MTILQQVYPGDAMASFIIRVLAEITLVTVIALVFGRIFARQNPALRHGVCVCALLCVLVAPLTTLGLQQAGWSTFQISLDHDRQVISSAVPVIVSKPIEETEAPEPFWTLERARSAASLTILLWLVGTGVLLIRLVSGARKVNRLRMASRVIEHPKLDTALQQLHRSERLPSVPVRFVRRLHSPVVVGSVRPTVILPEGLLEKLDADQLRCVLAHELTHVRQRDPLIGCIQRIVEASYWPHPFVHFLNRDLVRAREEVCDNVALNGTTAPQYATTLLTVALGISAKPAASGMIALMTPPWKLEERVKGLLDPRRRLITTMNTRHLALMAISLATGTTLIAGARVVAAPVPSMPQETVKIVGKVDPKTQKVRYTTKVFKQPKRALRTMRVKFVDPPSKDVEVRYFTRLAEPATRVYTIDERSEVKGAHPKSADVVLMDSDPTVVSKKIRVQYLPSEVKVIKSSTADEGARVSLDHRQEPTAKTVEISKTRTITSDVHLDPLMIKDKPDVSVSTSITTDTTTGEVTTKKTETTTTLTPGKDPVVQVHVTESKTPKVDLGTLERVDVQTLKTLPTLEYRLETSAQETNPTFVLRSSQGQKLQFVKSKTLQLAKPGQRIYMNDSWKIVKPGTRVHVQLSEDTAPRVGEIKLEDVKRSEPTTVYIKDGEIRIVGDSIRIVNVKSTPKPKLANKVTKPKARD